MEPLQQSTLYVSTLGRFTMTFGDHPISFTNHTATKSLKLLQILLYHTAAHGGISRAQLIEELFYQEELSDTANNLRVTAHRLKKLLEQSGLPEYDYIQIENGVYHWNSPMPVEIDALEFEKQINAAQAESDAQRKAHLYEQACSLYRGVFLPALSGDDWVMVIGIKYKKLYEQAFTYLYAYWKETGDYEKLLELATSAISIYPFDEWQAVKIEALMALDRYKEAQQYYDETSRMFFEELGITPSESMLKLFDEMSVKLGLSNRSSNAIKDILTIADYESGAFYCSLPSFRDNYRLLYRMAERNRLSVQVMVCSLTDGKGKPLEKKEKLEVLSEALHKAIRSSLRRGDCFTKFSSSQFLILLIGTGPENCQIIYQRIADRFCQQHKSWKKYITYSSFPVPQIPSAQQV